MLQARQGGDQRERTDTDWSVSETIQYNHFGEQVMTHALRKLKLLNIKNK